MDIKLSDHFTYGKLLKFSMPSVFMLIFASIYSVVDGFFISNFAGKTPFAAVNIIIPFTMMLTSFGFMISTGGSALVSMKLGEGHQNTADRYFSMLIYISVILGILLSVIGIIVIRPVSILLGADESMLEYAVQYGRVLLIFNVFGILQYSFPSFMVTAGKPHLGLKITIAAGLTNMVLDALFMAVLKLGVTGAALATGIGQLVGSVLPIWYFLKKNDGNIHLVKTNIEIRPILHACYNGMSELLTNVSTSVVSMVYNMQLMKYFGENGVSAYGVLMYTQFIFMAIFFGYTTGTAPIISFHYGADNRDELKSLFRKNLRLIIISGLAMFVLAELFSAPLSKFFVGYDDELFKMTTSAFKLFSLSFLVCGINVFASSFFTALNNGTVSAIISVLRTFVFQIAAVLILPLIFDINSIWLALTVSEVLALFVSIYFILSKNKKYGYIK